MNMRVCPVAFACSLLAFCGAARAQSAAGLVARIDSLYHATPNWSVEFTETVRYPVFDESETEKGALTVGPEGRFRLVTDRHVVVSDGDTLWTHNVKANQVTLERVEKAGEAVRPADFLFHFRDDYAAALCDSAGPGQCLRLAAEDETSFIREMWLWVEPKTAHVQKARYRDINQNETTFDFERIDFSVRPKPGTFHFDVPPGVEVVRMP
jgi:outer membrane lipoprotein-sorting protein